LADAWKKNVLENLETREVEFGLAGKFLLELKKKFGGGIQKLVKVAKLKKVEQRERNMEEFIQEFRRVARGSRYERRVLVEEFKREMNRVIRRKLMEAEKPLTSTKQWYEHTTNLDRH